MAEFHSDPKWVIRGIVWMAASGLNFVAVAGIVKHLGSALPAIESAFLRFLLGLVFILPMLGHINRARIGIRAMRLFGFRALAHCVAVALWFYAMTKISIAEVTSMNYLAPIYVTLGAAMFLGEPLAARRIVAITAAFVGALIILRPGFREISSGHVAMFGTAIAFAASFLIAKRLTEEFSNAVIVGVLSILVTIVLAPFAIAVWVTPTIVQLGWLFLVALFATVGHYTMTMAFRLAPLSVTQPVLFLQLVWATLLGSLVFHEPVDVWVVVGGSAIIASAGFIAWREAVLARNAAITRRFRN